MSTATQIANKVGDLMKELQMARLQVGKPDLWNEYVRTQTLDQLAIWQGLSLPHTLTLGWNCDSKNNHTLYIRRKSFMCHQMYIWHDFSIDQARQQIIDYFDLHPNKTSNHNLIDLYRRLK